VIVAQETTSAAALAQVPMVQPDLVLADVELPGMDGFVLTTYIKAQPQAPTVILMSASGDPAAYRARALAVGADGFVDKTEVVTALLPLIAALRTPDPSRNASAC
jgi:CheY-like chemotaxis protein